MKTVDILYEDADIIVVVKPPGMPSQAERGTALDMVSYLKNYLAKKGISNPYVAPVHRLDRPVGGVMVYARSLKAAKILSRMVQERKIYKQYKAVLCGQLPHQSGKLVDELIKNGKTNMSEIVMPGVKNPDAKQAVLEYKVLNKRTWNDVLYTLVQIHLVTGRHHQIRVQMAGAGAPIAGDAKYGQTEQGTQRLFNEIGLFSDRLEFSHPVTAKKMIFTAPASSAPFQLFLD
ncbi:MAG: RluA family pseudouridine synthase [Catenibacillus sp.]